MSDVDATENYAARFNLVARSLSEELGRFSLFSRFAFLSLTCDLQGADRSMKSTLVAISLLSSVARAATSYLLPLYGYPSSDCWPELISAA